MKTPRDILLSKHQPAMPKLDAVRQKAVGQLPGNKRAEPTASLAAQFWRELIMPCRRIWTGLAAVWLLIIIVNFSLRDGINSATGRPPSAVQMVMNPQAQQRMLNQLLADRTTPTEAEPPRNYSPKPRTATSRSTAL